MTGGLNDGAVNIQEVTKKEFETLYEVKVYKPPLQSNNNSTTEYCLPDHMKDTELEEKTPGEADGDLETILKLEG